MTKDLNISIAVAKQVHDELLSLTTMDELVRMEFGSGPKRDRIEVLLQKLHLHFNVIKRTLASQVGDSSEAPILSIPSSHLAFLNEVLKPNADALQKAYFNICGLGMLTDILDMPDDTKPKPTRLEAMRWGLERWAEGLDEDETFEWLDRGFNIEGALETVGMPWFEPDQWVRNFSQLQPVLVDRPAMVMNEHVRYRLTEIYRAFAFGLWMSAIALSRSLVEFSVKQNARRLGIEIDFEAKSGRREDKSLKWLGEDLANTRPELAAPFDIVRDAGNRILHPKKRDIISHPTVMRSEALDCIRTARLIVESVFSESPKV